MAAAQLERAEGVFEGVPEDFFFALSRLVPGLRGLAKLDSDGGEPQAFESGGLRIE